MADDDRKSDQAKRLEEMRQRMRSSRSPDKQRTRTPGAGGDVDTPNKGQLDAMRSRRATAMAEASAKKKERELNKQIVERKKEREEVPVSETFLMDEDVMMAVRRPMRGE